MHEPDRPFAPPAGLVLPATAVALLLAAGCAREAGGPRDAAVTELLARVIAVEDARPRTTDGAAPLFEAAAHADPAVRRIGVRSLGRQQRPDLVPHMLPLLEDRDAGVRAEAANALGQAVRDADPAGVRAALLARLDVERDAGVLGAIALTLGRLPHDAPADVAATAGRLAALSMGDDGGVDGAAVQLGVARGMFRLARQPAARGALPEAAVRRLAALVGFTARVPGEALDARRVRTLATAALAAAGQATAAELLRALEDTAAAVRREAALGAATLPDTIAALNIASRATIDAAPAVRYDGLRSWLALGGARVDCPRLLAATADADDHVALLAIDSVGRHCAAIAAARLDSLAAQLPPGLGPLDGGWHRAARAFLALAGTAAPAARAHLPRFAASAQPFVRMYAARAAGVLGDAALLRTLLDDSVPNVRTEALRALAAREGRGADGAAIAQLRADDSQLVQTAARALDGTRDPHAKPALLDALDRFTARRRETERDARRALLERIRQLGTAADTARIRPLLEDWDALIADLAAATLEAWTGTRPATSPRPLPRQPVPAPAELDALAGATFVFEMHDGGSFTVRLRPWDAPTNAARFARFVRDGWFDGLTFHRVAPNFVVQGGSPNANEYAGDGPYTRDELGMGGHWRGTVGLSTRGHDTGDGQIFVNLVDNTRLDHAYTIFGDVVAGMDVIDRLQEGAAFRRVVRRDP
jgi:cyclophilin family peptidyl-prolyl cis-trans isomerase/HEAT repeat protein